MDRIECACDDCKSCCENTPGWFAPGEAEEAAALKGLTLQEFFARFLTMDYWCNSADGDIYTLRPAHLGEEPGQIADWNPLLARGTCVFLTEDRLCSIHAAKPLECAATLGCGSERNMREDIARLWDTDAGKAESSALKHTCGNEKREPDLLDLLTIAGFRIR